MRATGERARCPKQGSIAPRAHHSKSNQAHISRPLSISKQTPFNSVRSRHISQLGGRNGRPAVIMRVQRQHNAVTLLQVPVHPFDRVGVDVGGGHFDGGGEVEDELAFGSGFEGVGDGVADFDGVVEFGSGVRFGRVFIVDVDFGADFLVVLEAPLGTLAGNVGDAGAVLLEDDAALQGRGRVVDVDDGLFAAFDRLESALDERFAALFRARRGRAPATEAEARTKRVAQRHQVSSKITSR